MISTTSPSEDILFEGDIVIGDFDNEFVVTFTTASESFLSSLSGDGCKFYLNSLALVIKVIDTPESFYSTGFCKLLLPTGEMGWLPSRWLKKAF
jgi:hypothetical protein